MTFSLPKVKVQIVSRYVPSEHRAGHFTYVLDFMRYLHRAGCVLELVVLDQWFLERHIPQSVRDIASISIRPSSELSSAASVHGIKPWFRPLYRQLPDYLLSPLRKTVYRLRGKPLPGVYAHDALATQEEIAFITKRYTAFQPDVMIANQTYLGNMFSAFEGTNSVLKVILTIHIEHQRTQEFTQATLHSHDSLWNWEKEAQQVQHADVLLAIQKEDAKILKEMAPHSEVLYAPMSATYHHHDGKEQVSGRCLFIGSDVDHNVHGIQWFLDQVWPKILLALPQGTLHICGTVCSRLARTYPNVQLLGRVEDLDAEYGAASVCLIPLVVGSGLKIKLVEALSHGRACASTSAGVQGIQEIIQKAVLVGDTPDDFAQAVITMITHPEKRKAMEEQARKYVLEELSPERAYQPFVDRIYQHIEQRNTREDV